MCSFYCATLCYRGICCRVSVCLSVTNQYCIKTTVWIELVFGVLASTYPILCCKEIWVSLKLEYFHLELCPKLQSLKISPRQVDHVVNKTCRRRSRLLTTPIRQSTSRGHLLGQSTITHYKFTSICYGFIVRLLSTVAKILIDVASWSIRGSKASCPANCCTYISCISRHWCLVLLSSW